MSNPYAPPPRTRGPDEDGAEKGDPPRQRPWPGGVTPPARPSRPKPTEEQVRAAGRRVITATLVTLGALVGTALPLPWLVLGSALALLAVLLGVRAVISVVSARLMRSLLPLATVSLILASLFLFSSLAVLATWPIHQARQDCLARALTVSARDACEADYREALEGLTG